MERSIAELCARRTVCDKIIHTLLTECAGEPEQADALAHYRAQLAKLDAELTAKEKAERERLGLPEPEPVVVGLKPAVFKLTALS